MLYSNVEVKSKVVENTSGEEIYEISLVEEGRGRKAMRFSCDKGLVVRKGFNPEITIVSRQGKAHLTNKKKDTALYMLISSKGGSTTQGDGKIFVSEETADNVYVIARGYGADGLFSRTGKWDCMLIRVRKPTKELILQIQPSGLVKKNPAEVYVLCEEVVYSCDIRVMKNFSEYAGVEPLCKISRNEDGSLYFADKWIKL